MFSFRNILKIDNLIGLESLTKLQLDNNIIKKIENIGKGALSPNSSRLIEYVFFFFPRPSGHLTNLTWLDLSFNNIQTIEGLEVRFQSSSRR